MYNPKLISKPKNPANKAKPKCLDKKANPTVMIGIDTGFFFADELCCLDAFSAMFPTFLVPERVALQGYSRLAVVHYSKWLVLLELQPTYPLLDVQEPALMDALQGM